MLQCNWYIHAILQVLRPLEEIIIPKYVVCSNSNRVRSALLSTENLATTSELLSSSGWEPRICFPTWSTTDLCVRNAYFAARLRTKSYEMVCRQQAPQKDSGGGGCMACLAGMCLCCCAEGVSRCAVNVMCSADWWNVGRTLCMYLLRKREGSVWAHNDDVMYLTPVSGFSNFHVDIYYFYVALLAI